MLTKENVPVDDVSHGLSSSDVNLDHRWFCDPGYLWLPKSVWPQSPPLPAIEDEPLLDWVDNVMNGELQIGRLVRDCPVLKLDQMARGLLIIVVAQVTGLPNSRPFTTMSEELTAPSRSLQTIYS